MSAYCKKGNQTINKPQSKSVVGEGILKTVFKELGLSQGREVRPIVVTINTQLLKYTEQMGQVLVYQTMGMVNSRKTYWRNRVCDL